MNIPRHGDSMKTLRLEDYIERQNPKNSNFDTMNNLLDIETDFETLTLEEELQRH